MEKDRKKFLAILSISLITILGSTAVSPALAGIKSAFPELPDDTVQLVLTIPPLFIIPSCFLCNAAAEKYGKKQVLVGGILLYLIGGLGAGMAPDFKIMLLFRGILGVGCGFITPLAQALISEHFSGKMKEKMTGYSASASYLMGIIASFTVAQLADISWRLAFCIYFVAAGVLALNLIYLPKDGPVSEEPSARSVVNHGMDKGKMPLNRKGMGIVVGMMLINVAFYTFSVSIALFMKQEQIGTSTSSGTVVAVFMITGFLLGLITAYIRKVFRKFTMGAGLLMMGSGYCLLAQGASVAGLCAGAAMVGGSYSILYSGVFYGIGNCSRSKRENTRLVTWTTAGMFIGQSVSAYLLRGAERLAGRSGYRFRFAFLSGCLLFAAVVTAAKAIYLLRKEEHK